MKFRLFSRIKPGDKFKNRRGDVFIVLRKGTESFHIKDRGWILNTDGWECWEMERILLSNIYTRVK